MQDFFNALFDFSFKEFVTIKIIKVIYGIGLFFAAIGALALLVKGFQAGFFLGILALIVLFRISEDVNKISQMKKE